MSISHNDFFADCIKQIGSLDETLLVSIITEEGFVAQSNMSNADMEGQIGGLVSIYVKYGKELMEIPFFESMDGNGLPLNAWIGTGNNRFIVLTQFISNTILAVLGKDHTLIGPVMEKALHCTEAAHKYSQGKQVRA